VPASRSRTENWRRSLEKIAERNGALEITLPRFYARAQGAHEEDDSGGRDLIWRVRVLRLSDDEIVVEQPSTMGQTIRFEKGLELIGVIPVGQNRWMFHTINLGQTTAPLNAQREVEAIRLQMPDVVERCQRRSFYRISTVGLLLPNVSMWPVIDSRSLPPAEIASAERLLRMERTEVIGRLGEPDPETDPTLPEVGPALKGSLVNIGGGGVGVLLDRDEAAGLDASRTFWMNIDLTPDIPAPLGVAAKLAHTHMDSEQRTYAGMSFEFSHSPDHMRFVVDRICRYVMKIQREQLRRRSEIA